MALSSSQEKNLLWITLLVPAIFILGVLLLYQVVVEDQSIIIYGILAVLFFIICFSSIRLSLILLVFSMLLSPEIGVAQTVKREVTLRFDDILLLIITIGWLARMAVFSDLGLMLKNPINKPIMAFSAVAAISTTLGAMNGNVNPLAGFFFVLKMVEYFFLFSIVVNYVRKEEDINQLLNSLLIVFGIICLYGLFMVLTGGDVSAPFEGEEPERNTLGGYLVLMASVAVGVMLHSKSQLERNLIAIILPIFLVVLLFSISRSGWLSAITALFVLFISTKRKGIFFAFILVALLIVPFVLPDIVQERISFTFFQSRRVGQQVQVGSVFLDTSSSARLFSYKLVLSKFLKNPLFGFGITGFGFIDGQFFRNLIEIGILGSVTFLWLLVGVHNIIRKATRIDFSPRLKGLTIGFYAAFWAMMAHALTANTFIIVRIAEPFWCIAGLMVSLSHLQMAKDQEKNLTSDAPQPENVSSKGG